MSTLRMIVGLGNPGPRYAHNRHNIGFQCIELLARRHQFAVDRMQLRSLTGAGWIARAGARRKVILAKPMTYMNESGAAVAPLAHFYKIEPSGLLVVHDDLDLEAGKLRLRARGSSGGQNGVQSIIDRLGSQEFARAKVGIGRPPGRMDPASYVLQDFTAAEEELFGPLREQVCDALEWWLFDGIDVAMNRFNG